MGNGGSKETERVARSQEKGARWRARAAAGHSDRERRIKQVPRLGSGDVGPCGTLGRARGLWVKYREATGLLKVQSKPVVSVADPSQDWVQLACCLPTLSFGSLVEWNVRRNRREMATLVSSWFQRSLPACVGSTAALQGSAEGTAGDSHGARLELRMQTEIRAHGGRRRIHCHAWLEAEGAVPIRVRYHCPGEGLPHSFVEKSAETHGGGRGGGAIRLFQVSFGPCWDRPTISLDVEYSDIIVEGLGDFTFPHSLNAEEVHPLSIPCGSQYPSVAQQLWDEHSERLLEARSPAMFRFLQVQEQLDNCKLTAPEDQRSMMRYARLRRTATLDERPAVVPQYIDRPAEVVISVFIEGTGKYLDQSDGDRGAVLYNLYRACEGVDLGTSDHSYQTMSSDRAYMEQITALEAKEHLDKGDRQFKIGFNGCSTWQGILGWDDIQPQVKVLIARIEALLQARPEKPLDVRVNVLGFSRGAVTAVILAKHLSHLATKEPHYQNRIHVNLALVDPVPGESERGAKKDESLTAQSTDASDCSVLGQVLILYAEDPTRHSSVAGYFWPLVPRLPATCHSEVDVIPGEHSTWQGIKRDAHAIAGHEPESWHGVAALSTLYRLKRFLHRVNTRFTEDMSQFAALFGLKAEDFPSEKECWEKMARYLLHMRNEAQSRPTHNETMHIVRKPDAVFLNKHHEQLLWRFSTEDFSGERLKAVHRAQMASLAFLKTLGGSKTIEFEDLTHQELQPRIRTVEPGCIAHQLPSNPLCANKAIGAAQMELRRGDMLHSIWQGGALAWEYQASASPYDDALSFQRVSSKLDRMDRDMGRHTTLVFCRYVSKRPRYLLCVE